MAVLFPIGILCSSFASVVLAFPGDAVLPADCAIVFGNAVDKAGRPGPGLLRRVETAVRLQKDRKIGRLILTGGKPEGYAKSEAAVMRDVALANGADPSALTLEERASSTLENLQFSRPLLEGCDSTIGISDRSHLARIRLLAGRQGWGRLPLLPADDLPPADTEWRSLFRETMAYAYYLTRADRAFPGIAADPTL
jgi:uncharacterized SAM-binding protein YcdF (DUF218 family)